MPDPEIELDIRVVSVVADDSESWSARADYDDDLGPFEAIGMMMIALAREVAAFLVEDDNDDD